MKRADAGWIGALAVGAAALYFGFLQERFTADGPGFTNAYLSGRGETYYNVLFVPFCRLVGALLPVTPYRVPHVASALAGVLAVALTYPVLRAFDLRPRRAVWGSLLLAVTPPMLFFSTTSELHSLQLACVVLAACVTLYGPWQRPALALALTAAVFPLLFWSHVTAVLLGPGWVLLVQVGRTRRAAPFRWRTLLLVVGPALLAALLLAVSLANLYRLGRFTPDPTEFFTRMEGSFRPPLAHRMIVYGWLLPLLVVVPAAAWGALRWRPAGWTRGALALLILPSLVFYLVIGVPERGAYFLGTIPFWIVLAAHAFPAGAGGAARAVMAAALGVQTVVGVHQVVEFDRGYRTEDRVEAIRRALGEEGVVLSGGDWALDVRHFLPGVEEISAWVVVRRYYTTEARPEAVAAMAADGLELILATRPIVADLSYRGQTDNPVVEELLPWMRALEAEYVRRFDTEVFDHPDWPMMRLHLRGSGE